MTHSIELLTCAQYGCPGCTFRHFHRTSDDAVLTEVPEQGMFTRAQLAAIGRAAVATGAVSEGRSAGEDERGDGSRTDASGVSRAASEG